MPPCPSSSKHKSVRVTNGPEKASARRGVISGRTSAPAAKAVPLSPAVRSHGARSHDGTNPGVKNPAGKILAVRNLAEIRPRVARFARVNAVRCVGGMPSAAG